MVISILIDNPDSWIYNYSQDLFKEITALNHQVSIVTKHADVQEGDILILLGCNRIFKNLDLNKHNLIVHESDLPEGRGMSPFTWQVLEGKREITITLLEAAEAMDAGDYYDKVRVKLHGTELVEDWRKLQYESTLELITKFLRRYPEVKGIEQQGTPTFYRKRTIHDSKIDIDLPIRSQFNLLRVVDNNRYPAWFEIDGAKYKLSIERMNDRF